MPSKYIRVADRVATGTQSHNIQNRTTTSGRNLFYPGTQIPVTTENNRLMQELAFGEINRWTGVAQYCTQALTGTAGGGTAGGNITTGQSGFTQQQRPKRQWTKAQREAHARAAKARASGQNKGRAMTAGQNQ